MTRQECIEAYRHEIGGMVLDAYSCGVRGPEGSLIIRQAMKKIDVIIAKIYEDATRPQTAIAGRVPQKG